MTDRPQSTDLVRIRSDEHHAWWGQSGRGYVTSLLCAGYWPRGEAERMTGHCGPEKKIVLVPITALEVQELAETVFEHFQKLPPTAREAFEALRAKL